LTTICCSSFYQSSSTPILFLIWQKRLFHCSQLFSKRKTEYYLICSKCWIKYSYMELSTWSKTWISFIVLLRFAFWHCSLRNRRMFIALIQIVLKERLCCRYSSRLSAVPSLMNSGLCSSTKPWRNSPKRKINHTFSTWGNPNINFINKSNIFLIFFSLNRLVGIVLMSLASNF